MAKDANGNIIPSANDIKRQQRQQQNPQDQKQNGQGWTRRQQPKQVTRPIGGNGWGQRAPKGGQYTVQAGDSFESIAGQFGGDQRKFQNLMRQNGYNPGDVLQAGAVLNIPDGFGSKWSKDPFVSQYAMDAQNATAAQYGWQQGPGQQQAAPFQDVNQSYWSDPQKVAAAYQLITSQGAGWAPPPGLDVQAITDAYKMFEAANKGLPSSEWKPLQPGDPVNSLLNFAAPPAPGAATPATVAPTNQPWSFAAMSDAQKQSMLSASTFDISNYDPATRQQMLADPNFDWSKLPRWQKWWYDLSSNAGAMGAATGAIFGGGPVGALVGAGIGYVAGVTGYDPAKTYDQQGNVFAAALGLMNLPAEKAEQAIGFTGQVMASAQNPAKYGSVQDIADDPKAAWEAAKVTYENAPGAGNLFAFVDAFLKENEAEQPFDNIARLIPSIYYAKQVYDAIENGDYAGAGEDFLLGRRDPIQIAKTRGLFGVEAWQVTDADLALYEARQKIEAGVPALQVMQDAQQYVGGQVGDLVLQGIFDPLNVVGEATNKAAEGAAKLAGNAPLAASFAGATGVREGLQAYRDYVRTNVPVDMLTSFDRWAAGLDKSGAIKDYAPVGEKANPLKSLVSLTPQSKAMLFTGVAFENVTNALNNMTPEEFAKAYKLWSGGDMAGVRDMGAAVFDTPEMYTALPALKGADVKIMDAMAQYETLAPNRDALASMAQLLGQTPAEIIKSVKDGATFEQQFARMIDRAKLATGDADAAAFIKAVDAGTMTPDILTAAVKVFTETDAPYTVEMWKAQTAGLLMNHAEDWIKTAYNLKPDSPVMRVFGLMKSVQSIVLLGLSPTYVLNNSINNAAMLSYHGLMGMVSGTDAARILENIGTPARMDAAAGMAGDALGTQAKGALGAGYQAIKDATTGSDGLASAQRMISAAGEKLGIFAKLSGQMEAMQSRQAFLSAMKAGWARTWLDGVGYRRMSVELERALNGAGLKANDIYGVINGTMNQKELAAKVEALVNRGQAVKVSTRSMLDSVAASLGQSPQDAAELLGKMGMTDYLDKALQTAKTPDEIDRVFQRATNQAQDWLAWKAAQDFKPLVEHWKNKINTEGVTAVSDILIDAKMKMTDVWDRHGERLTDVFGKRKSMTPEAWNAEYNRVRLESTKEWARTANYERAGYMAVVDALGIDDPRAREFLGVMADNQRNRRDFFRTRDRMWDEYVTPNGPDYDTIQAAVNNLYRQMIDRDLANQAKFDKLFTDVIGQKFGPDGMAKADGVFKSARDIYQERAAFMQAFRQQLKTMTKKQRVKAWAEFWKKDNPSFVNRMVGLQSDGYRSMFDKRGSAPAPGATPPVPQAPTPQASLFATDTLRTIRTNDAEAVARHGEVWKAAADLGMPGIDNLGFPVQGARLDIIKMVKEWGGADGKAVRTFDDMTPELLRTANENKAAWQKQQAEMWSAQKAAEEAPAPVAEAAQQPEAAPQPAPQPAPAAPKPEAPAKNFEPVVSAPTPYEMALENVKAKSLKAMDGMLSKEISRALTHMSEEITTQGKTMFSRIIELGGIKAKEAPDLIGEGNPFGKKGVPVGLFKKDTDRFVRGLDQTFSQLMIDGYFQDDADLNVLREAIRNETGGDATFSRKLTKSLTTKDKQQAATIERLLSGQDNASHGLKATPAEQAIKAEAFRRVIASWDENIEIIAEKLDGANIDNVGAISDLFESVQSAIEHTPDYFKEVSADGWAKLDGLLEQAQRLMDDANEKQIIADEYRAAQANIGQAEAQATTYLTREAVREQLVKSFKATDAEADAAMAVLDARAETWARAMGAQSGDWYAEHVAGVVKGGAGELGYPAYHGSPYKFDKFTLDKIGSGEGAQAYGWGLYFTDSKALADWYREKLVSTAADQPWERTYKGQRLTPGTPEYHAATVLFSDGDLAKARKTFSRWISEAAGKAELEKEVAGWQKSLDLLNDATGRKDFTNKRNKGQTYKVEIPDDGYLLWDKPLSEQPQVMALIQKEYDAVYKQRLEQRRALNAKFETAGKQPPLADVTPVVTGKDIYAYLEDKLGFEKEHPGGWTSHVKNDKAASIFLRDAGIPGIKYLDGNSRSAGEGSYNYVIFDDQAVKVLETYYKTDSEGTRRAAISFIDDGRAIIHALETKNSIVEFMHETGHLFRRDLYDMATRTADEAAWADIETVEKWAGVERNDSNEPQWSREAEEKFARGFEAYLAEGNAPSAGLARVFAQLKDWMLNVYRSITGSAIDVGLTDEMRGVFDRMLASQTEAATTSTGQAVMFGGGEDTPLFSGTAQSVRDQQFTPQVNDRQGSMFPAEMQGAKSAKDAKSGPLFYGDMPAGPGLDALNPEGKLPPNSYDQLAGWFPEGAAWQELFSEQVQPLLDGLKEKAREMPTVRANNLAPETLAMLNQYAKQVGSDMGTSKLQTMRWAETQRDNALLNYNRKFGIDNVLNPIFPYQFWSTRSMANWAWKVLDRPAIFSNYYRLRTQMSRYEKNLPERLRGKIKIPMPFLPEWAGDSVYVSGMAQLFPFENFARPLDTMMRENGYQANNATYILKEWATSGEVTQAEAQQASDTKTGPVWERALAEAGLRMDKQISSPFDFAGMMFGPAWYLSTPLNLMGVETPISSGKPGDVGQTALMRTGTSLQTATADTPLAWLGQLGGLLAAPERFAREKLGLQDYGGYTDYYIDRQLANMAADGAYSIKDIQQAMIERSGPLFDEAKKRVDLENMTRTPGSLPIYAAAHGDLKGAAAALPASMLSGSIFPDGELKYMGLKEKWNAAWTRYNSGDKEAINQFFVDHPEYQTRLALRDTPEERLRQFMITEVWDRYMAMDKTDRRMAAPQLGDDFEAMFLNKETRSYESIPPETLATWARILGGVVPRTAETQAITDMPEPMVPKLQGLPAEIKTGVNDFYAQRDQQFKNIATLQDMYYSIPADQKASRRAFAQKFPELSQYWDWKSAYLKQRPALEPFISQTAAEDIAAGKKQYPYMSAAKFSQAMQYYWTAEEDQPTYMQPPAPDYFSELSPITQRQVMAFKVGAGRPTQGAMMEIRRIWEAAGKPTATPEQFLALLVEGAN